MIDLGSLLFQIFDGFLLGAIYSIFALGLTLLFGVMRVINNAHGDLYMWSAMLTAYLAPTLGLPLTVVIVAPLMVGLGVTIDRGIFQPLRSRVRPEDMELSSVLVTMGLSIIVINSVLYYILRFKQSYWLQIPPFIPGGMDIFGITIPYMRFVNGLIAILLVACLFLFLKYTWIGRAIRATAQDKETAMLLGVNPDSVNRATWALASLLVAVAGFLVASLYVVNPLMGFSMLIKGFAIIIIGGLGSVWGTLLAGFGVAIVENVAGYVISPVYKDTFAFFIMLVVLLVKRGGIFGAR